MTKPTLHAPAICGEGHQGAITAAVVTQEGKESLVIRQISRERTIRSLAGGDDQSIQGIVAHRRFKDLIRYGGRSDRTDLRPCGANHVAAGIVGVLDLVAQGIGGRELAIGPIIGEGGLAGVVLRLPGRPAGAVIFHPAEDITAASGSERHRAGMVIGRGIGCQSSPRMSDGPAGRKRGITGQEDILLTLVWPSPFIKAAVALGEGQILGRSRAVIGGFKKLGRRRWG